MKIGTTTSSIMCMRNFNHDHSTPFSSQDPILHVSSIVYPIQHHCPPFSATKQIGYDPSTFFMFWLFLGVTALSSLSECNRNQTSEDLRYLPGHIIGTHFANNRTEPCNVIPGKSILHSCRLSIPNFIVFAKS
jgi:hypothetical protein